MNLDNLFGRVLEITIVAVVLYLVLSNAFGFSTIIRTAGDVYAKSVAALQGR
jgi:hypothetical protein